MASPKQLGKGTAADAVVPWARATPGPGEDSVRSRCLAGCGPDAARCFRVALGYARGRASQAVLEPKGVRDQRRHVDPSKVCQLNRSNWR
eukprot:8950474-Alexandrium_andersonii.AAC.1